MAGKKVDCESLMSSARELEKQYDWRGAAGIYARILSASAEDDPFRMGVMQEAHAYALCRAAFQSNTITEFREMLESSSKCFQETTDTLRRSKAKESRPYVDRCLAMMSNIGFWRSEKGSDKKRHINDARRLAKEAMSAFEDLGDSRELIVTYNRLWPDSIFCNYFEDNQEGVVQPFLEGVDFGERALRNLSNEGNEEHLAVTHTLVGLFLSALSIWYFATSEQRSESRRKAAAHWQTAVNLSRVHSATTLMSMTQCAANSVPFDMGQDEFFSLLLNTLDEVRHTNDRLMIGSFNSLLAYHVEWRLSSIDDKEDMYAQSEKAVEYANEANKNYAVLSPPSPILSGWDVDPELTVPSWMLFLENDREKRRSLAESSLKSRILSMSSELGLPGLTMMARARRVEALNVLAATEDSSEKRARLYREAIEHGRILIEEVNRIQPFLYMNRGIFLRGYAVSQYGLAMLIDDPRKKVTALAEAVRNRRESKEIIKKDIAMQSQPLPGDFGILAFDQFDYGTWLMNLCCLDDDRKHLEEAASVFEESAESYESAGMPSRMAEGYWKAAEVHQCLEDNLKASERFTLASRGFGEAKDRIPRLKGLYEEHSKYMNAWSEVEKARHYHVKQDFLSSRACWENAARLHESIDRWKYLAPNYLAWARVENAEELSRSERSEEAYSSFEKAAETFREAKDSIQSHLSGIEDASERNMATKLMSAAGLRQDYCKARTTLEKARILDKRGDESAASEIFGKAAEMLQKTADVIGTEGEKREFQLIAVLSRAWQSMTRAEAEASPELYAEAGRLFDQAKNLSSGEKSRLMAQAHSRFCKALEAGTRFADTGEPALYETAVQNLNSAANYYAKAGLESASEYTKASKLLFDGYVYTGKASKEEDQDKKARLFAMAEKVLRASASSFEKAGQLGKKEQVEKLLERAMDEKELAVSLTEVLIAPDVVSATTSFKAPASTHETAVGLERFEHADVQATLIAKPRELHVGQEISLEIELVNAGRGAAQLTKVEETVPTGFVVVQEPEKYRMEDSQINLRGRRLDALKTEDVRLVLKPTAKGNFKLKPRITYLDESGTNRSCEPNPVEVTVREMGIAGWIRGT